MEAVGEDVPLAGGPVLVEKSVEYFADVDGTRTAVVLGGRNEVGENLSLVVGQIGV